MIGLPLWAQWAALAGAAVLALFQVVFVLFVLWPSIRLQVRFIKAQEKKGVDSIFEHL